VPAEVIGFRDQLTLVSPLEDMSGVRHGSRVRLKQTCRWLSVGQELLGRVIDASGRVIDAVERSIAIPLFFPPCPDELGVWCDAGGWESVPVSHARRLSPDPVIGVWVDVPKPGFLSRRPVAPLLRAVSRRLARGGAARRLTARRYLSLLTARLAEPVLEEQPELLIRPPLGLSQAWRFSPVARMSQLGYREARRALEPLRAGRRLLVGHAAS